MTLTHKDLHAAFNCGSPNRHQCKLLGISYPLPSGWLRKLIGKEMTTADYAQLVALRKPKGAPPLVDLIRASDVIRDRPIRDHREHTQHEAKAVEEFKALLARHDSAGVEKIATMLSYARANGFTVNMTV